MDLAEYINHHRAPIEQSITTFLDAKKKSSTVPEMHSALKEIANSVNKGKMLRGVLVILGAELWEKPDSSLLYPLSAAMELLQTGLIIHDDIMDNDLKRRGQDTVFYRYMKEGKQKNSADFIRYGQAMGICVGDVCFFLATELLGTSISEGKKLQTILPLVSQEVQQIHAAQMTDALHGLTHDEPSEEEIINKYRYKTARYTFSLPLTIGTIMSGHDDTADLMELGELMGIVFQLRDDMIGIFGTETEIGKVVGSDIRENKKTLVRSLLFQKVAPKDKLVVSTLFGRTHASGPDIEMIQTLMKTYNVDTEIERIIDGYSKKISVILNRLEKKGADISLLKQLVLYNATRKQ